jgi:hypothetical protein
MRNSFDLITIASAKAQPGKEKTLEQALRAVAAPTRAQPGCVDFSLHRSKDDPAVIIVLSGGHRENTTTGTYKVLIFRSSCLLRRTYLPNRPNSAGTKYLTKNDRT